MKFRGRLYFPETTTSVDITAPSGQKWMGKAHFVYACGQERKAIERRLRWTAALRGFHFMDRKALAKAGVQF